MSQDSIIQQNSAELEHNISKPSDLNLHAFQPSQIDINTSLTSFKAFISLNISINTNINGFTSYKSKWVFF